MRTPVVAAWAVLGCCLLASCPAVDSSRSSQPGRGEVTAHAETLPARREAVTFFVYTHCGVESARIGGRWWHATKPLYAEDSTSSAPAGWDDPYQEGQLTVESSRRAVFVAEGATVVFEPSTTNKPVRLCR